MTRPNLVLHHEIGDDDLVVDVVAYPVVNLALVHNGVPLVQQIQVRNVSTKPVSEVHLEAELGGLASGEALQWAATVEGLRPGEARSWEFVRELTPERTQLQQQTEAYKASLAVTVSRPDAEALAITAPIDVLAHNEWFAAEFCLESLATFVEPNDSAITAVLSDASDILEQSTGDGSIQGYQAGPQRAGTIAAAIYAALTARRIRYIEPPASFENRGQKVRSPRQVLDDRFGTCLDLSTLYASCLEQAGLNPLLWIVDGHAFVGFMRDDSTLPNPVVLEQNRMVNLAESGRVVIVEADFYTSDKTPTFRNAADAARRHLATPERHLGIIDVRAARRAGVRPFARPQHDAADSEQAGTSEADLPEVDLSLPESLTTSQDADQVLDTADDSPARVRKWKRALLDLSTRNRLLNLRPSREVVYLSLDEAALARVDDLVHAGKKLTVRPGDDLAGIQKLTGVRTAADLAGSDIMEVLTKRNEVFAGVSTDSYVRTFKNLQRTARTLLEETGSANLYLTFGTLVHHTTTGSEAHAPLFLLPIRVVGGTGNAPFELVADSSGIATPNHCLTEWLRVSHNVVIDSLSTPPTDDFGIDIAAAVRGIRQGLVDHNLDFRIEATAAVAICKFGTFGMWRDLQNHWPELEASPLVRHLTYSPGETFIDPQAADDSPLASIDVDEVREPLPVHYDGSQLKAVELAAMGRTFVLQGPPGTGKSQTITNLIARNLAAGRTVLFVAEKQAALDVVRTRLHKVGLSPFILNLHGSGQQSENIRKQIKESLEFSTSHNDRRWQTEIAQWKTHHTLLDQYPKQVHEENAIGDSLWRAADALAADPDAPYLEVPTRFVATTTVENLTTVRSALVAFSRRATPALTRPENPWTLAVSVDETALETTTGRAATALSTVLNDAQAVAVVESLDDPAAIDRLLVRADTEARTTPVTQDQLDIFNSQDWAHRYDHARILLRDFEKQSKQLSQIFHTAFLTTGDPAVLASIIRDVQHGVFKKKRRSEEARTALRAATLPGVELTLEEAPALLDQVPSLRAQADHVRNAFLEALTPHLPPTWSPLAPGAQHSLEAVVEQLRTTWKFANDNPEVWETLRTNGPLNATTVRSLRALTESWRDWVQATGATDDSLRRWRQGRGWFEAWRDTQAQWSADLAEHGPGFVTRTIELEATIAPLRDHGLSAIADDLMAGRIPALEAESRFLAGLTHASITERTAAADLNGFVRSVQDGRIDDFAAASDRIRELLTETLPSRLAADRPFDPNRLTGRYGSLRRALDGKRNATSVRSLVRDYGPEIQSATPCFLVSPTSLAQYVQPGSIMFDLVVFDEASQVTVAQSIGAIGRARSAVIVGDPKQMPPTMIGVATGAGIDDEESEESTPEDLESILDECLESGIPPINLTWHYRSEDESLIAFSNEKYYESKLATLPSPGSANDAGTEFRRVNGHFNREDKKVDFRTNRVEAEAIVAEIQRRVALDPKTSIGVVTFNRQQQDLILNLLEATRDKTILSLLAPDAENGLFVKNLENVQGDERDVILFSTAFSKKPGEDQLPLNFGPLTRAGGEKRLNVAVTRARRKVIVFSSFDPTDIDLNRTRSKGMADLRAYLEAAAAHTLGSPTHDTTGTAGLEDELTAALRDRGFEVQRNYGMSDFVVDIAVRSPQADHWQVAVMLDGPAWGRRATVNDRDLTPRLLRDMMGWHSVQRVWLPEWLQNRTQVLARITEAVELAEHERAEAERLAAEAELAASGSDESTDASATDDQRFTPTDAPQQLSDSDDEQCTTVDGAEESDSVRHPEPENGPTDYGRDIAPAISDPSEAAALPDIANFPEIDDLPQLSPEDLATIRHESRPAPAEVSDAPAPATDATVISPDLPAPPDQAERTEPTLPPIIIKDHAAAQVPDETNDKVTPAERRSPKPEPFVPCMDTLIGDKSDLDAPSASTRQRILDAIIETVNIEGPIERDELCGRIVRRFDISKAHAPRRNLVASVIPKSMIRSHPDLGSFVWPTHLDPETWHIFQTGESDFGKRKFEHIAPEEVFNALEYTAARGILDSEDLIRKTLAEFGIHRVTTGIQERIDSCIKDAMRRGRLAITPAEGPHSAGAGTAHPAKRRARTNYTESVADLISADLLSIGEKLKSRDNTCRATVLEGGVLEIDGRKFTALSSAATYANTGISTNGWIYWFTESGFSLSDLRELLRTERKS